MALVGFLYILLFHGEDEEPALASKGGWKKGELTFFPQPPPPLVLFPEKKMQQQQQFQPASRTPLLRRTLSGLPTATVVQPPSPTPPPATGSWLPACTTVNVGSRYDLLASATWAPLSSGSAKAAAASADDDAAAAAAKKEAALDQMTGPEFLASIGVSPSFSPPPRRLPINNLNETQGGGDALTGASVCANDSPYSAGEFEEERGEVKDFREFFYSFLERKNPDSRRRK